MKNKIPVVVGLPMNPIKSNTRLVLEFLAIALVWGSFFTALILCAFLGNTKADYSYQSYFSEYKEIFTDCKTVTTTVQEVIGYTDNSIVISSLITEQARLEALLERVNKEIAEKKATDNQPIMGSKDYSKDVCVERTVVKPYCWDWIVNNKEQCDWQENCSNVCTCKEWYFMANPWVCAGIPMSEAKEIELPKTGASIKKKVKR